jgi:hypothetical protein
MTAARNTVIEDVAALRVKVESGEERDKEAREHIGELFKRIDSLKDDVSSIKLTISNEFGQLRVELAKRDERDKASHLKIASRAGAKWAAIVSAVIGFATVVVDKFLH